MNQKRFGRIVGDSPRMRQVFRMIQRAAEVDLPVLIMGEQGTGKELVARELHRRSNRVDGPFVCVDTGSFQGDRMFRELFGQQENSSVQEPLEHHGCLDQARRGTLFINEAAALEVPVQSALLRAIEEGVYRPLGAQEDRKTEVRLVAATTADLEALTAEGLFRKDLLLRLKVLCIPMPPVRERTDDLEMLAESILEELASEHGITVERISAAAYEALSRYTWPGNVRELQNILTQAAVAAEGGVLRPQHLPAHLSPNGDPPPAAPVDCEPPEAQPNLAAFQAHVAGEAVPEGTVEGTGGALRPGEGVFIPLGKTFDEAMHAYAALTLRHCGNNKTKAAQLLGVSRKTLYERLARWEKNMHGQT